MPWQLFLSVLCVLAGYVFARGLTRPNSTFLFGCLFIPALATWLNIAKSSMSVATFAQGYRLFFVMFALGALLPILRQWRLSKQL